MMKTTNFISQSDLNVKTVLGSCVCLICHHQPLSEYEKQTDSAARLSFTETGPQSLLCEWRSVADSGTGGRSGNRRGSGLILLWQIEWHLPWSRALTGWGGCGLQCLLPAIILYISCGPPIYSRDRMWMVCPVSLFILSVILVYFLLHSSSLSPSLRVLMGRWIKHSTVSFPSAASERCIDWFSFKWCKNVFFTLIFLHSYIKHIVIVILKQSCC